MVVGTVGSNVVPVMQKICTENNTFLIIPTAASNDTTRAQCHPLVFRVSHSNWQITAPAGSWLFKQGKKRVMTMGMNYAAGKEEVGAFADEFKKAGGEIIDQKWPGLKELDYQAYFADVLAKQPDAMFTFFAGSNAVEFVKQYAQAGLKERVPLYGSAYLTDSTLLAAQGAAADGVITSGHWAPSLDNAANKKFLAEFKQATGKDGDLNSMHGHDTLEVIAMGLETTKGDVQGQAGAQPGPAEGRVRRARAARSVSRAQETRSRTSTQSRRRAVSCVSWKRCKTNVEDPTAECRA